MGREVEPHSPADDVRWSAEPFAEERDEEVGRELVPELRRVVTALPVSFRAGAEPLVDLVGFSVELTVVIDDVAVPARAQKVSSREEKGGGLRTR